jgi:ribosomal 50S subunit-associated protein YjgA (DUF615 family)
MVKSQLPLDDNMEEAPPSLKAQQMAAMQKVIKDCWPKEDAEVVEVVESEFKRQMKDLGEKDKDAVRLRLGNAADECQSNTLSKFPV